MVAQTATLGVALTVLAAALAGVVAGGQAAVASAAFGGLATALQVVAVAVVLPTVRGSQARFLTRWGLGMGIRLLGVGLLVAAVLLDRASFPPLPSAWGLLVVLVPLLFFEARLVR